MVPLVVVPEVATGVVGRVCDDEVHSSALLIECHHRLEVVPLDHEVLRLEIGRSDAVGGHGALDSGPHPTRNATSLRLASEGQPNTGLDGPSDHPYQFLVRQLL